MSFFKNLFFGKPPSYDGLAAQIVTQSNKIKAQHEEFVQNIQEKLDAMNGFIQKAKNQIKENNELMKTATDDPNYVVELKTKNEELTKQLAAVQAAVNQYMKMDYSKSYNDILAKADDIINGEGTALPPFQQGIQEANLFGNQAPKEIEGHVDDEDAENEEGYVDAANKPPAWKPYVGNPPPIRQHPVGVPVAPPAVAPPIGLGNHLPRPNVPGNLLGNNNNKPPNIPRLARPAFQPSSPPSSPPSISGGKYRRRHGRKTRQARRAKRNKTHRRFKFF